MKDIEYKIEKNIPMPDQKTDRKGYAKIAKNLGIGESVLCVTQPQGGYGGLRGKPLSASTQAQSIMRHLKLLGRKGTSRGYLEGVRVWRIK